MLLMKSDETPCPWFVDQEACTVRHTSGLVVVFNASPLLPGAVLGEIVEMPANASHEIPYLLKEAATVYAAARKGTH